MIIYPKDIVITNEHKTQPIQNEPGEIAHVFKYEYEGCIHRFLVETEKLDFDFLCLYGTNYKKIVKVKGPMNEKDYEIIEDFEKLKYETNIFKKYGVKIVSPDVCEIGIEDAKPIVQRLNDILEDRCDDLRLVFDYQHMINGKIDQFTPFNYAGVTSGYHFGILLCLMHKNSCISSIEIEIKGELFINSKTMEEYEGKNYNKFLRSVVIIIAPYLGCKKVRSVVENPSSGWILLKYFNADILKETGSKANPFKKVKVKKITKSKVEEYTDEGLLHLEIDLTPENIFNAEEMFLKTLKTFKCIKHRDTRKKYLPADFGESAGEWGFGKKKTKRKR